MANTYEAIATVEVGSGGATDIDFTSIPGTYTDLLVYLSGRRTTSGGTDVAVQFNGDTAGNYSWRMLYGDGASAVSQNLSSQSSINRVGRICNSTDTASTFGSNFIYIPNYTSSNVKSTSTDGVSENNATTALAQIVAGLWSGTAAITSIKFVINGGGTFAEYSTATLYGIKNS